MDAPDMRMRWFVRDNDINNYRIKRHAESDFYGWVASWASVLRKPSDIGFVDNNYNLPKLNYIEKYIEVKNNDTAQLFSESSVNATQFNKELKVTMLDRLEEVADIVNNSNENFIIWVNQNEEDSKLLKLIPDAISVRGSEKTEIKERKLLDFANNKFRVLITKKKIAQFGLNFQNCRNQVFASLDFSFEGLYQAIRRSYRFGQSKEVNIYIVAVNTMQNVVKSINKKQKEFNKMMEEITKNVNEKEYSLKLDYEKKVDETENYKIFNGDSCELLKEIETNSIDFSIFSPPFSNLFTYSDNLRDLGNSVDNEEFFKQNDFLLNELYRVVKNGRLVAIHSKDLAVYKNSSGYSGMYDFTGDYHRAMEKAGFKYHSKITIWIDPVLEMQRTKTQRLLHKQVTSDSSYSGIGMPEYVTIFRKWEGDEKDWQPVTNLNKDNFPVELWQKWASPVWFDIDRTNVMNSWRDGKNEKDEKHICPLQLDVIERLIAMYSNKNEKVLTPFMGIGSEVYQAVKMGRYGVGIELKESYFEVAKRNLRNLTELKQQQTIF